MGEAKQSDYRVRAKVTCAGCGSSRKYLATDEQPAMVVEVPSGQPWYCAECRKCQSKTHGHGKGGAPASWTCLGCERSFCDREGCADDMPDHCDQCWAKAQGVDIPDPRLIEHGPPSPKTTPADVDLCGDVWAGE